MNISLFTTKTSSFQESIYQTKLYFCMMLIIGFILMVVTSTFFANAGVLPPVHVSRGKLYTHAKQNRTNTTASIRTNTFRPLFGIDPNNNSSRLQQV